eukprot:CAMPEP_0179110564 /NCGR_PEP_ID=MMETSP0796-20121207/51603_1 /TAXON_ID=73915 /ORGANISM="Pyrodinium bahamense, Strain pbaha01" /LENGTH=218 /DNA_ID=CAMNT_0020808695 /DNA_START=76 /DNA_END=731 /DNA_ORIENTATION=+
MGGCSSSCCERGDKYAVPSTYDPLLNALEAGKLVEDEGGKRVEDEGGADRSGAGPMPSVATRGADLAKVDRRPPGAARTVRALAGKKSEACPNASGTCAMLGAKWGLQVFVGCLGAVLACPPDAKQPDAEPPSLQAKQGAAAAAGTAGPRATAAGGDRRAPRRRSGRRVSFAATSLSDVVLFEVEQEPAGNATGAARHLNSAHEQAIEAGRARSDALS